MNDDEFEKKLHALTGALHRPDPTPAWKADILARARREADAIPIKRLLPPRWLMLGWAAAWAAIVGLHFTTPGDVQGDTDQNWNLASRTAPPATRSDEATTLLAFHRHANLDPDLP